MRQLVGLACARCSKTIGSIVDSRFCAECGCPVHNRCMRPVAEDASACPVCGAPREISSREQALHAQDLKEGPAPTSGLSFSGAYGAYQYIRLLIGGFVCGCLGIGLIVWELSERQLSVWGIVRGGLISVFGFGLAGVLGWLYVRQK
jgi:hypothetical protein